MYSYRNDNMKYMYSYRNDNMKHFALYRVSHFNVPPSISFLFFGLRKKYFRQKLNGFEGDINGVISLTLNNCLKVIFNFLNGIPYFLLHILVHHLARVFQNTIIKFIFIKYFSSYKA